MKKSYLTLCFLIYTICCFAENENVCVITNTGSSGQACTASGLGYVDPCSTLAFQVNYNINTAAGFIIVAKYEWFVNGVSVKVTTTASDPVLVWQIKASTTNVQCKVTYKKQDGTLSQVFSSNTFTPNVKILNFSDVTAVTPPPNYGCTANPVSYSLNTYTCSGPAAFCSGIFNATQYQISWQPPSGWTQTSISANGNNVSFLPDATTGGTLTATITLSCGYKETRTLTINRVAATPAFASSNSSTICASSASLSINPICGATNYTYAIAGNAGITFTSNGLQTLTTSSTSASLSLSGGISAFVLSAKANYPGNNVSGEASTAINFGAPPLSITSSTNGCNGAYKIWNIVNNTPNNGTNWYWTVGYVGSNSQITIFSPSSPSTMLSVKGGGTVNLNYVDLCGVTRTSGITVNGGGCFAFKIAISPNPSKSNMSISLTPENSSNQSITNAAIINNTPIKIIPSAGKTIMSLFEVNSNTLVKQWAHNEVSNLNYNFNINGLPKGVYILQIDRNGTATTTKVIIE
jgi:hypothetical protein